MVNLDDTGFTIENRLSYKREILWTDERRHKKSESQIGEKNHMYGKSFYDCWLEKFGKEIADKKLEELCKRKSEIAKKGNWFTKQKEKSLFEQLKEKYGEVYAHDWLIKKKNQTSEVTKKRIQDGKWRHHWHEKIIQIQAIRVFFSFLLLQKKDRSEIIKELCICERAFFLFCKENEINFKKLKTKYYYGK